MFRQVTTGPCLLQISISEAPISEKKCFGFQGVGWKVVDSELKV